MSEHNVRLLTAMLLLQQGPISLSDTVDLIGMDTFTSDQDFTTHIRFSLSCNRETYYIATNIVNLEDCKDIDEMVITALKGASL